MKGVLVILLIIFLCATALPEDSASKVRIVRTAPGVTGFGAVFVWITVVNMDSSAVEHVGCRVRAWKEGVVVDSAFAWFNEGAALPPGITSFANATLFGIRSRADYDSLTYGMQSTRLR